MEIVCGYIVATYTISMIFLTRGGRGKVPVDGNNCDSFGDLIGFGKNPQNGVALSSVTPFTKLGLHAAK